jgi:hypothetical protein
MLYELATLTIRLGRAAKGGGGIDTNVKAPEAKGNLLGCWATEIGDVNQLIVLRGFADASELEAERWRTLSTSNRFNCGEVITRLSLDSYTPFPFLPPLTAGKFGSVCEIPTYGLKLGGVPPTIATWQAAIPERTKISPLIIAMYALAVHPYLAVHKPRCPRPRRSRRQRGLVTKGRSRVAHRGDALDDRAPSRNLAADVMPTFH